MTGNTTADAAAHAICRYSLTKPAHLHEAFQVLLSPVCLSLLPLLELHGVLCVHGHALELPAAALALHMPLPSPLLIALPHLQSHHITQLGYREL